jgi:hypothetical protein
LQRAPFELWAGIIALPQDVIRVTATAAAAAKFATVDRSAVAVVA